MYRTATRVSVSCLIVQTTILSCFKQLRAFHHPILLANAVWLVDSIYRWWRFKSCFGEWYAPQLEFILLLLLSVRIRFRRLDVILPPHLIGFT